MELLGIKRYATSVDIIADKGNETTSRHNIDTRSRWRRGSRTTLAVASGQYSLVDTREIPHEHSLIAMAGIMLMEFGNRTPEDVS